MTCAIETMTGNAALMKGVRGRRSAAYALRAVPLPVLSVVRPTGGRAAPGPLGVAGGRDPNDVIILGEGGPRGHGVLNLKVTERAS